MKLKIIITLIVALALFIVIHILILPAYDFVSVKNIIFRCDKKTGAIEMLDVNNIARGWVSEVRFIMEARKAKQLEWAEKIRGEE